MAKCPKCGGEIDSLVNVQSGYNFYDFNLGDNGEVLYESRDEFEADGKVNEWQCPKCREVLFTDEGEAIKFLEVLRSIHIMGG